jgi:phosphate transport system permease protein
MNPPDKATTKGSENQNHEKFEANIPARHRTGKVWRNAFIASTVFAIVMLTILLADTVNKSAGYVAMEPTVPPAELTESGKPIEEMSEAELIQIINENLTPNRIKTLEAEQPLDERSIDDLQNIVINEIVKPKVKNTWKLVESIFNQEEVFAEAIEKYPKAYVLFQIWIDRDFITSPQSSNALVAGVRTAILGSLYVILITIVTSFPIGIGAAIYLQEYASNSWINRVLQTNINNLAGVPSIIYGMLGLTIFVRGISAFTSGAMFGYPDADPNNGRTILSAGLTMAVLILPVIIINAQEAIKAVPNSLREASFGIGASKWQTVWSHVLPNSIPGILTGTILSISRAFGETAPLILVGAATFITYDPDSIFSKFTTLPIQIYQWTSRPQDEFRNIAAAAIIVLLVILMAVNALAIYFRNRYTRSL